MASETTGRFMAVFFEGDFEETRSFSTLAEARAFSEGVDMGAGAYGGGTWGTYVLPEDEEDMRHRETPKGVERALAGLAAEQRKGAADGR